MKIFLTWLYSFWLVRSEFLSVSSVCSMTPATFTYNIFRFTLSVSLTTARLRCFTTVHCSLFLSMMLTCRSQSWRSGETWQCWWWGWHWNGPWQSYQIWCELWCHSAGGREMSWKYSLCRVVSQIVYCFLIVIASCTNLLFIITLISEIYLETDSVVELSFPFSKRLLLSHFWNLLCNSLWLTGIPPPLILSLMMSQCW